MKKLALGLGTAALLTVTAAAPAMAQVGFYAGLFGVGVGVGKWDRSRERFHTCNSLGAKECDARNVRRRKDAGLHVQHWRGPPAE